MPQYRITKVEEPKKDSILSDGFFIIVLFAILILILHILGVI